MAILILIHLPVFKNHMVCPHGLCERDYMYTRSGEHCSPYTFMSILCHFMLIWQSMSILVVYYDTAIFSYEVIKCR